MTTFISHEAYLDPTPIPTPYHCTLLCNTYIPALTGLLVAELERLAKLDITTPSAEENFLREGVRRCTLALKHSDKEEWRDHLAHWIAEFKRTEPEPPLVKTTTCFFDIWGDWRVMSVPRHAPRQRSDEEKLGGVWVDSGAYDNDDDWFQEGIFALQQNWEDPAEVHAEIAEQRREEEEKAEGGGAGGDAGYESDETTGSSVAEDDDFWT
ncbi:hypothetical protein BJ546DRAFT_383157 [Cryomyces antarcticus]|nr:hypothetical protein LTR04_006792 [Oleoguttula sp. CCFEE 6159]